MAILGTQEFEIDLTVKGGWDVYLTVKGKNYSGSVSFEVDESEYKKFEKTLAKLYKTLKEGEAVLNENFGGANNITIRSDGLGHFIISGVLYDYNKFWKLSFSETVDQTYFKRFISELENEE